MAPTGMPADPLRLAPGVELLGAYRDSGLENPPFLVRRGSTMLHLSQLLVVVAAAANGRRDFDEIAVVASAQLRRQLTAHDVQYLIEAKLAPAGIVTLDGAVDRSPPPRAADERMLALRFRRAVVPPQVVNDAARALSGLFRPTVVAAILVGVGVFDGWLFGVHGVNAALDQVIRQPGLLPFLLVVTWFSGAFHELGHASGCAYSGARPGAVGVGIYLIWPVLYTNVTDAYRLGRVGRLRTDLGGIYFNTVFIAVLALIYAATGYEPLLAAVLVQHVVILDQLMPWIRFDGYYVISDLVGVPDIFNRVRPALQSLLPGRPRHPEIAALRPGARRLLLAYLGSLVIFVAVSLVATIVQGPGLLAAGWDSLPSHVDSLQTAVGMWDLPMGILVVFQIVLLAAPAIGFVLTLGFLALRLTRTAGLRSE